MMRWLGCMPLDATDLEETASTLRLLEQRLKAGAILAVFPEGRRLPNGKLGLFSDVFFRLAIDAGAPVYPLMIHCKPQLFGPQSPLSIGQRPPRFRFRLGGPAVPQPGDRAADLARRTRKWLGTQLEPLDAEGHDS
ncbi:MAG: 1-acyl-sn-glycerol-3-phosphate acyltransferase [Myxococcota bacterium]|nr:1-acyl-sn-glycerol-3-phosphate acyltransferase [Myxococcota bacterium]